MASLQFGTIKGPNQNPTLNPNQIKTINYSKHCLDIIKTELKNHENKKYSQHSQYRNADITHLQVTPKSPV